MIREFTLINEKGQVFSLMDIRNYCLLTVPNGLGYAYETSYEKLGNSFIENLRELQQGVITGELNFANYDNYNSFVNYIENSNKLRLSYKIPFKNKPSIEYFRDIHIQSIGKREIQLIGIITEPIVFECKGLWYEENQTIFKIEPEDDEIRWDFYWDSRFNSYNNRSIAFNNQGHTEAPFTVEIEGKVINPIISIYVNDKLIDVLNVNITIEQYEKLLYSTIENDLYLHKQEVDGSLTNIFNFPYVNINNNNIFKLPKGVSEIRITAENDVLNAKLNIYPQYKAV
jgi:hypothetical protein